jgi:hypothetical protein
VFTGPDDRERCVGGNKKRKRKKRALIRASLTEPSNWSNPQINLFLKAEAESWRETEPSNP